MRTRWTCAALLLLAGPAWAQQSASFKLREHVFNAGGIPAEGTILSSPSYRITLGAVGESLSSRGLASASFHLEEGFVSAYPPPGEAQNLMFDTATTMLWDPEGSIGTYNVYRDLMSSLSAGGFGACFARELGEPTAAEPSTPPSNNGWFYLVTAENRLRDEGTKGYFGSGAERGNAEPCP